YTGGWFVGSNGVFRKALTFFDSLGGGQVVGLAVSRNPMRALDDCGNLAVWTSVRDPNNVERDTMFLTRPVGSPMLMAQQGTPTGDGGTFTSMDAWPTLNGVHEGVLGAGSPGNPGVNTRYVYRSRAFAPQNGDVNSGAGPIADVLRVNGNVGSAVVATGAPITVAMSAAPGGPTNGRYFFYGWRAITYHPVTLAANGQFVGCMVEPTPLHTGQLPQPLRCVHGTGIPAVVCNGVTAQTGPPTAPFSITVPHGFAQPITLQVQGVLA